MKNNVKIPVAFQIRVDDVGWHKGDDDRWINRPSRSGLPRMHHKLDYEMLARLGKELNTKIGCSLVLGEWDKDNILRGVPHVTYDVEGWDRASEIDIDACREFMSIMENSEYIDYTLHGLLHGYYDDGKLITERHYYPLIYDKEKGCYTEKHGRLPSEEFRRCIELFYEIYNSWGFKKEIRCFASPCGCKGTLEENSDYIKILKEFGIRYWNNGWCDIDYNVDVYDGIICAKGIFVVDWNVYDIEPKYLPLGITGEEEFPKTDLGFHWTNFLRYHPQSNFERLADWVGYFNRQAEIFGTMLSRDTAFAESQALYNRFAKLDFTDGKCVIDTSEVDAKGAIGLRDDFYISFKNPISPKLCEGGDMSLYEVKKEFKTYRIERKNCDKIIIDF